MNPQSPQGVSLISITDLDILNSMLILQQATLAQTIASSNLNNLRAQKGIDAIQARITQLNTQ